MHFCKLVGGQLIKTFGSCLLLASSVYAGELPLIPFSEQATQRGVTYLVTQEWANMPFGEGLGFIDLDGDGDDDLVTLGDAGGKVGIFENNGDGYFTDRSNQSAIPFLPKMSGVAAADFDQDGDLDLYITRWEGSNALLKNNGQMVFEDITLAAGVAGDVLSTTTGCAWGDYNKDGFPDLVVSNRNSANHLYKNRGDGTFEDVAVAQGIDQPLDPTFQISFFDFDRDQDPDLYISNDRGMLACLTYHNYLFENVDGNFVDITDASGTHSCTDSMTVTLGDFSGNGMQDIYVTSQNLGNSLLENNGDGSFTDHAVLAGVASYEIGWGAVFFDYNHDGFQELYVCNMAAPNRFYHHNGNWPCEDLSSSLKIDDQGESYSVATSDIDGDGDLDFALSNRAGPIQIFVNNSGGLGNWVQFDVVGTGADRWAIGTNIDINHDGKLQTREIIAGSNYKSQNSLTLHFGIGASTQIDTVNVFWPNGQQRSLTNMPANQEWRIFPQAKLGDSNLDGFWDASDFTAMLACKGDSLVPGCEGLDMDGNGKIDLVDVDAFLMRVTKQVSDCDSNTQADWRQIFLDPSLDLNQNLRLDLCECLPDLNNNGQVNLNDLLMGLPQWRTGPSPSDLDFNGTTDIRDFTRFPNSYGDCLKP